MKKINCFLWLIMAGMAIVSSVSAQGVIWGMTSEGGVPGGGVIFKTNFDGSGYDIAKSFDVDVSGRSPYYCQMVPGPGALSGKFYGTTLTGGKWEKGTLFEFDPVADTYKNLIDFGAPQGGAWPLGSLVLYNGRFYGMTSAGGVNNDNGTIFEYDPVTKIFNVKAHLLASETGKNASGGFVVYNNKLYGMTREGGFYNKGVILEFNPAAANESNLVKKYDFNGTDGALPVFEMTVSGTKLYGMTPEGGANNKGVLFEFDPAAAPGSNYTRKVSFDGSGNGDSPIGTLYLLSGKFYGMTTKGGAADKGVIFEYTPGNTSVVKKIDVNEQGIFEPTGNFVYANGLLYGSGRNFIFSYDPAQSAGNGFTNIVYLAFDTQGSDLYGGFAAAPSGKLYGLCSTGGETQSGTIVEYDPAAGISASNPVAKRHFYSSVTGFNGSLNGFAQTGGKLYGATLLGAGNGGVVFEFNPADNGWIQSSFVYSSSKGRFPSGAPAPGGNGKFYGTTQSGNGALWVVYEYDPVNHTITDKVAVTVADNGMTPNGALVPAPNGKLYGAATSGGLNNVGTIFEYDPANNTFTKKLNLEPMFGQSMTAPLMLAPNGKIYGTSRAGGVSGKGIIFEYEPGATTVRIVYDFTGGVNGEKPYNVVLTPCAANGKLYGTTSAGGANGGGIIFEYTLPSPQAANGTVSKVFDFAAATGKSPRGRLAESRNGKFYGLTMEGGAADKGVLFEFDPIPRTYTKKTDLTGNSGYGTTNGSLAVIREAQSIYNFSQLPDKPYGTTFTFNVPSTSGLPVSFRSSNTAVATVMGNQITVTGVGTTTITAIQPGNGGYFPAPELTQTLTTIKGNQVITFNPIPPKTTADGSFTVSAVATSTGQPVTYSSSNTSVATVSGNTVTIVGEGATVISATAGGTALYFDGAAYQTLTVNNTNPKGQLWGMTYKGGSSQGGVIFSANADATPYLSVQKTFGFDIAGERPESIVMATNGKFYGTTKNGGDNGDGLLFEYNPATLQYKAVYHFTRAQNGYWPNKGLMLASNGKLYGTTAYGGTGNVGVIYEFDPATGGYRVVFTFQFGSAPAGNQPRSGLIEASNGKLYGTTSWGGMGSNGILYEFDPGTLAYVVRYNFPSVATGAHPDGPVMQATNGKLYGMTVEGGANNVGVIYEYDLNASAYNKVVDLSEASGRNPSGGFTQSSNNSKLYGLTYWGQTQSSGAILQFDPATGTIQSLALGGALGSRPSDSFVEAPNGNLYCLTSVTLLELNPATFTPVVRYTPTTADANGSGILSKAYNGKLYGTTPTGGIAERGTIFSFDYTSFAFEILVDFGKATGGAYPLGSLVRAANGKLYGMMPSGGANDLGFIFEFDPATRVYTKKVDFTGANGSTPMGGMTLGVNGKLYGMTTYGGNMSTTDLEYAYGSARKGYGVIFEYDPSTNIYTPKKNFDHTNNGRNPQGDLTLASNGKFYGLATSNLGPTGYLFEYDAVNNQLESKITFNFSQAQGYYPSGTLTQATDGKLYGTAAGGANSGGVIFQYDPVTNVYTKKSDFTAYDNHTESNLGYGPTGKLTLMPDGKLYGMTTYGGYQITQGSIPGGGTIFEFDPSTGALTRKFRFGCNLCGNLTTGVKPRGGLTLAPDNKLYGMTSSAGASADHGTVFQFDPATAVYTKKIDFNALNGSQPQFTTMIFAAGMMDQSIAFAAPAQKTVLDTNFNLEAAASSGLPVTLTSSDPNVATVSGNTVTIKGGGSTTITATQGGNADYNPAASVERTLVVSKADQTISFSAPGEKGYGDAAFTLQATATSGLPVTYTSSNTAVATVSGNTVTIVGLGTTTLKATQPGNNVYNAAAAVTQTLTVNKGSQTITFAQVLNRKFTDGSVTLAATASSGLPVSYAMESTAVAAISGNVVTFLARGTVTITASQAGNGNYQAATSVQRSLVIENSAPVANKQIARQEAAQLVPFSFAFDADVFSDPEADALTYSARLQNGQALPAWITFNAQARTFSGTPQLSDRTIDVRLTATDPFDGAANVDFKIGIAVITGVETTPAQELEVYPNPVQTRLVIQHNIADERAEQVLIRSSMGSTIYENKAPENRTEVDAGYWQAGVYIVEIRSNKTIRQIKVIKK